MLKKLLSLHFFLKNKSSHCLDGISEIIKTARVSNFESANFDFSNLLSAGDLPPVEDSEGRSGSQKFFLLLFQEMGLTSYNYAFGPYTEQKAKDIFMQYSEQTPLDYYYESLYGEEVMIDIDSEKFVDVDRLKQTVKTVWEISELGMIVGTIGSEKLDRQGNVETAGFKILLICCPEPIKDAFINSNHFTIRNPASLQVIFNSVNMEFVKNIFVDTLKEEPRSEDGFSIDNEVENFQMSPNLTSLDNIFSMENNVSFEDMYGKLSDGDRDSREGLALHFVNAKRYDHDKFLKLKSLISETDISNFVEGMCFLWGGDFREGLKLKKYIDRIKESLFENGLHMPLSFPFSYQQGGYYYGSYFSNVFKDFNVYLDGVDFYDLDGDYSIQNPSFKIVT